MQYKKEQMIKSYYRLRNRVVDGKTLFHLITKQNRDIKEILDFMNILLPEALKYAEWDIKNRVLNKKENPIIREIPEFFGIIT